MENNHFGTITAAARILRLGGVVAYPTEACFGLGCDPRNLSAVRRILRMKKRTWDKGLIIIADRLERLLPYLGPCEFSLRERILRSDSVPVSWVCPASSGVSRLIRGKRHSIAVRITHHPPTARLCQNAAMALVSTSANVAGQAPLRSPNAVFREFGRMVDMVVDAPVGDASRPSAVIDLVTGEVFRT